MRQARAVIVKSLLMRCTAAGAARTPGAGNRPTPRRQTFAALGQQHRAARIGDLGGVLIRRKRLCEVAPSPRACSPS
jgi:hypothetical protein